jgi:hypothetical protein
LVVGRAALFAAGAFFTDLAAADDAAEVAAVVRAVVLKVHPSLSDRIKSDRRHQRVRGEPAGLRAGSARSRRSPVPHNGLRG